jgi:D-beta-D-heptose 7-phosphate kinase/D-beta-D-heptose 1-phosphate adenosyltransferase
LLDLLGRFVGRRVAVVGDLMLDEYWDGEVSRISPEAPVPVLEVRGTWQRMGGAANVAHGLATLGAEVALLGAVGDDEAGNTLLRLCQGVGIDTRPVLRCPGVATLQKTRVVAQHQQLLRVDRGERCAPPEDEVRAGAEAMLREFRPDAIVLSDYGKGLLGDAALRTLLARVGELPVLVDPKRRDFAAYRGATVLTPNRRELEAAVGRTLDPADDASLEAAARDLVRGSGLRAMLVTLGERGGLLVCPEQGAVAIRPPRKDVFDVTGAGDTLIAVLALGLCAGARLEDAARLAHEAAGIVVGKFGTAVVTREELEEALVRGGPRKVLDARALDRALVAWRRQGRRIVFTNGCFDVLHTGHLSLLRQAAALGDVLVVGINDDDSVRRLKGPSRPLVPAMDRAALVAALDGVAATTLFSEDTPREIILRVQPDVLVKGADYRLEDVVGADIVAARGGRVLLVPLVRGRSTTGMIERVRDGSGR